MKISYELMSQQFIPSLIDGSKIRTSRPIKGYVLEHLEIDTDGSIIGVYDQPDGHVRPITDYAKYQPGDIFYVRETWCRARDVPGCEEYRYVSGEIVSPDEYCFKAGSENPDPTIRWHPSIHMPREAARLWFRVTDVKAQNIADMTEQDAIEDGFKQGCNSALREFKHFWSETYGPDSKWMWVYYFEPCENPDKPRPCAFNE